MLTAVSSNLFFHAVINYNICALVFTQSQRNIADRADPSCTCFDLWTYHIIGSLLSGCRHLLDTAFFFGFDFAVARGFTVGLTVGLTVAIGMIPVEASMSSCVIVSFATFLPVIGSRYVPFFRSLSAALRPVIVNVISMLSIGTAISPYLAAAYNGPQVSQQHVNA